MSHYCAIISIMSNLSIASFVIFFFCLSHHENRQEMSGWKRQENTRRKLRVVNCLLLLSSSILCRPFSTEKPVTKQLKQWKRWNVWQLNAENNTWPHNMIIILRVYVKCSPFTWMDMKLWMVWRQRHIRRRWRRRHREGKFNSKKWFWLCYIESSFLATVRLSNVHLAICKWVSECACVCVTESQSES